MNKRIANHCYLINVNIKDMERPVEWSMVLFPAKNIIARRSIQYVVLKRTNWIPETKA